MDPKTATATTCACGKSWVDHCSELHDANVELLKVVKRAYANHLRAGCYTKSIAAAEEEDCTCLVWTPVRLAIARAEKATKGKTH